MGNKGVRLNGPRTFKPIKCLACPTIFTPTASLAKWCSLPCKFWKSVDKSDGPDACWPWMLGRDVNGYGRFCIAVGDVKLAHRIAWELTNGPIPAGLFVCHHCDNPPCCNPAHHFIGTNSENLQDASRKGLLQGIVAGERHPRAKLTEADVRSIRLRFRSGEMLVTMAREFGMDASSLSRVASGEHWKCVK